MITLNTTAELKLLNSIELKSVRGGISKNFSSNLEIDTDSKTKDVDSERDDSYSHD